MVARAARSFQSLRTIGIACETRGTRRSLRVSRRRFQLSGRCWNLYAVPVLFERKTMETNHRDFSLSSLLPFASIQETLLSLPCLFFHSPGLFDRCYLSARKESEYAFSRKRVSKCLEILMYATRGKGQEKVVSSIFNYIEPS